MKDLRIFSSLKLYSPSVLTRKWIKIFVWKFLSNWIHAEMNLEDCQTGFYGSKYSDDPHFFFLNWYLEINRLISHKFLLQELIAGPYWWISRRISWDHHVLKFIALIWEAGFSVFLKHEITILVIIYIFKSKKMAAPRWFKRSFPEFWRSQNFQILFLANFLLSVYRFFYLPQFFETVWFFIAWMLDHSFYFLPRKLLIDFNIRSRLC